jgi:glycine dehydrogenase subunit 1
MATADDERFVREYNGFLISITGTAKPGQFGFGLCSSHQTSYGMRELGKDWTGNSVYLWAIANAVYLALLGPAGMREVGQAILQRASYAAQLLANVPGVKVPFGGFFKEFVVDFTGTGKSVAAINRALRAHKMFGGKDLSAEFPEWGQIALYCVTEIHTQADIDRLVDAVAEAVR